MRPRFFQLSARCFRRRDQAQKSKSKRKLRGLPSLAHGALLAHDSLGKLPITRTTSAEIDARAADIAPVPLLRAANTARAWSRLSGFARYPPESWLPYSAHRAACSRRFSLLDTGRLSLALSLPHNGPPSRSRLKGCHFLAFHAVCHGVLPLFRQSSPARCHRPPGADIATYNLSISPSQSSMYHHQRMAISLKTLS